MKIVILSGSPRNESVTRRVALHLENQLRMHTSHEVERVEMKDWSVPPVQTVWNQTGMAPEALRPLAEIIFSADAYILVTPEYNGSYSPALKNLLDHFPKRLHKTFGIATASPGAMGGMRASQQLLLLVPALFGIASPHMLIVPAVDKKFDETGNLLDDNFSKGVQTFLDEFLWLAEKLVPESVVA